MWVSGLRVIWNNMMKKILFTLLFFAACISASAGETGGNSDTDKNENLQIEKTIDKSSEEKPKEVETPDSFDPTEELSEDIPAIFPVDI